jgi:hypothetical protein
LPVFFLKQLAFGFEADNEPLLETVCHQGWPVQME